MTLLGKTCERCGASFKEAPLTRSHAPRVSLAKQAWRKWNKTFKIYILCSRCHAVYTEIERQVIRDACVTMKFKHAEYVNQRF